jgi:hypothetical protein
MVAWILNGGLHHDELGDRINANILALGNRPTDIFCRSFSEHRSRISCHTILWTDKLAWSMPPGALDVTIRKLAIARMRDHVSWVTVACELQRDWGLPTGQDLLRVFRKHNYSYGLLVENFGAVTANVVRKASWLLRAPDCTRSRSRDRALFTVVLLSEKVVRLVTAREINP